MEDRTGLDVDQAQPGLPWLGTQKKIVLNTYEIFENPWWDVFYGSVMAAIEPTIQPDAIVAAVEASSQRSLGEHEFVSLKIIAPHSDILREKEWQVHVTTKVWY
jgi:hypothetical protein